MIFDKVKIPSDCYGGSNKGDIFDRFDVINTNAAGSEITHRVVTIDRDKTIGVQSGNALELKHTKNGNNSGTFAKYYGKTFRISGELNDADGGARGADDKVGNWNANKFDISKLVYGTHTRKAVSNCNGNNPVLTYQLVIGDYIYE